MLHKEFWGLLFLAFVAWIILATTPTKRIEHACRPIHWVGNVITSGAALAVPTQQQTIQRWFDKLEYGCQYTTWRLFYQEEYNAWLASEEKKAAEEKRAMESKALPAQSGTEEASPGKPAAPVAPTQPPAQADAPSK